MFGKSTKKKLAENAGPDELRVKLKPVLGIKPGVYLSIVYLAAIILIIFLFLYLPGIINHGSRVYFTSEPKGASVWINNVYAGTTPFNGFISKGENEVIFKKPGFVDSGEVINAKGYIFATNFRSPQLKIEKQLVVENYKALFDNAIVDFLIWSSVKDYHESYQPEFVIAKTVDSLPNGGKDSEYTDEFLKKCFKNITGTVLFRDFVYGYVLNKTGGKPLLPANALDIITEAANIFTKNPAAIIQFITILQNSDVISSSAAQGIIDNIQAARTDIEQKNSSQEAKAVQLRSIEGKRYAFIPAGSYVTGTYPFNQQNADLAPAYVNYLEYSDFYIATDKITNRDFAAFIRENQFWSKDNKDKLIEEGFVTDSYLEHWPGGTPIANDNYKPVNNISYYAADAYCTWLSSKLSGYELKAVLPDEYMWETAGRNASAYLSNLRNVLWDWCSNWFNTADYIKPERCYAEPGAENQDKLAGIEKAVRGGSWANQPDDISLWVRAAQPANWCTPFTGFRVALVPLR